MDDFVALVAFGPPRTREEVEGLLCRPITEFEDAKLNFHNTFCRVEKAISPYLVHPGLETEQPYKRFWSRLKFRLGFSS